jgi:hypothetical protein
MSEIQPIIHQGRVDALVVGGAGDHPDALPSQEQTTVKAMCLYALEVAEGRLPGPTATRRRPRTRGGQAQPGVLNWLSNRCAPRLPSSTCPSSITRSTAAQILSAWQRGF